MSTFSDFDLAGLDIQWFAIDNCGHIAVFYTGGHAPLHSYLRTHREVVSQLEEYFDMRPSIPGNVPRMSADVRRHIRYGENMALPDFSDALHFAQRGLFAYDFSVVGDNWDSYYRLYECTMPLLLDDVDAPIRDVLHNVRMECDFAVTELIAATSIR